MSENEISAEAFKLLKGYIETECGISLGNDKQYLVESRLKDVVRSEGCNNFSDLYLKARGESGTRLRDIIIDAMTTNETLWFRDGGPFKVFREEMLPKFSDEVIKGKRTRIRIWCAACSTGQEPYSLAMMYLEYLRNQSVLEKTHLEIVASDISPTAIAQARNGRYNGISVDRGLPAELRDRYFEQSGREWQITDELKQMVRFQQFNLQDSFMLMGKFDIILARYVAIYFSDQFKQDLYKKIWRALFGGGSLFLGSSETMGSFSQDFDSKSYHGNVYYKARQDQFEPKKLTPMERVQEMLSKAGLEDK